MTAAHPPETDGLEPLHAWALPRTGPRVVWWGADPGGAEALQRAGREVAYEAPGTHEGLRERLRAFAPHCVVLEPGLTEQALARALDDVLAAAPGARILVELVNPWCAQRVVDGLADGGASAGGLPRGVLERLCAERGLGLVEIQPIVSTQGHTALAVETAAALHALLVQLSPESAVGRWRCVLARATAAPSAPMEPVPELLSVVLEASGEARLLDEALFSLVCQEYRPLEVLLVGPLASEAQALLERYRALEPFDFQVLRGAPSEALVAARGQYVGVLGAGCVVYPDHYVRLIARLREGRAAWALAGTRQARLVPGPEAYVETKVAFPLDEGSGSLGALLAQPSLAFAFVADRSRLGRFALVEGDSSLAALPLRLAALFPPALSGGIASLEERLPHSGEGRAPQPLPALQVLRPLAALVAPELSGSHAGPPRGLRHQLLDDLNLRMRTSAPGLHRWLKAWARRRVRRTSGSELSGANSPGRLDPPKHQ